MGLQSNSRETPHATFAELAAFRAKAIEMGYPSLAWSSPSAMPRYLHGNDEAKQDAQIKRIERRARKSDTPS